MPLFEKRSSKEAKSHLKNLIGLAMADDYMDRHEIHRIEKIGKKWGLSADEISYILSFHKKIKFVVPRDIDKKFDQLTDLIKITLTDGEISDSELDYCVKYATKLGFRKQNVEIVQLIVNKMQGKVPADDIKSELREFVK